MAHQDGSSWSMRLHGARELSINAVKICLQACLMYQDFSTANHAFTVDHAYETAAIQDLHNGNVLDCLSYGDQA